MRISTKKILTFLTTLFVCGNSAFAEPHTSANYALLGARIVASGGNAGAGAYALDNVAVGGLAGGKAVSANYILRAGLIVDGENLSLILNPISWELGSVEAGGVRTAKIIVENAGNVKTDYSIRVYDDSTAPWAAGAEPGGNKKNTFVMSAVFSGVATPSVTFNEGGNEDVVTEEFAKSSGTKFACAESLENGTNASPGKKHALWIRFEAPNADTTGAAEHREHCIYMEVNATGTN